MKKIKMILITASMLALLASCGMNKGNVGTSPSPSAGVKNAVDDTVTGVGDAADDVGNSAGNIIRDAGDAVGDAADSAGDIAQDAIEGAGDAVGVNDANGNGQ